MRNFPRMRMQHLTVTRCCLIELRSLRLHGFGSSLGARGLQARVLPDLPMSHTSSFTMGGQSASELATLAEHGSGRRPLPASSGPA